MADNSLPNLESRFFYRLVRVLYIVLIGICLLSSFSVGYEAIPKKEVNDETSILICPNGLHSFKSVRLPGWTLINEKFDEYYDQIAKDKCKEDASKSFTITGFSENTPEVAYAELTRRNMLQEINTPKYKLNLQYKTLGSWLFVFYYWLICPIIAYVMLNIIREALIYLAFGQRFIWGWLKRISI